MNRTRSNSATASPFWTIILFAFVGLGVAPGAAAVTIVHYDLQPSSLTSLSTTNVDPGFTASSFDAVGVIGVTTTNHFYHRGWQTVFTPSRYYEFSISAPTYTLDELLFSAELTTGTSSYRLASSLDGFASSINTFSQSGGSVTDRMIDLSGLGVLTGTTTFRFYLTALTTTHFAGFANHEPGGAGGGLSDVGRDIFLTGVLVPEPTSAMLLGYGLIGLALRRRAVSDTAQL